MSAHPAVSPSRCPRCGGICESNWITITLRRTASEFAILRNVPAEICQLCGETQFSMPTSMRMLASLQTTRLPDEVAVVPVYDFTTAL
ncbi:MAG TPA: YgiT-type zinc finger protein [Chthonomonadaceae bacterium]|nr:YgiT-type zinc finger protein [Chthonomonadaceae bacterium]